MFDLEQNPDRHLLKWFLASGAVGILFAIVLTNLLINDSVPTTIALALWPSAIFGMVDPHTIAERALTATFTFGGEFILYGLGGLALGCAVNSIRTSISRRQ